MSRPGSFLTKQSRSLGGGGSKHPCLPAPLLGERLCLAFSRSHFHQIQGKGVSERPVPPPDRKLSLSTETLSLREGPGRGSSFQPLCPRDRPQQSRLLSSL